MITADLAGLLDGHLRRRPEAVACRTAVALTYEELARLVDDTAAALRRTGVRAGTRTVVLVPPGPDLLAVVFALLRLRAVPVMVDPGLPPGQLRSCLAEAAPEVFIGIPLAQFARLVFGWGRGSVRTSITVGPRRLWLGTRPHRPRPPGRTPVYEAGRGDDMALLAYTSGSTGPPKGVPLRRRHLLPLLRMLRDSAAIGPGTRMLSTFPPFAMAAPLLGATVVCPDIDPRRLDRASPAALVDDIRRYGVGALFTAPDLLDRLARYCLARGLILDSLNVVLASGAPLSPTVLGRVRGFLKPQAVAYSVYGATECMPVSAIACGELAATAAATNGGAGTCLGTPLADAQVRVIAISDEPIGRWSDDLLVAPGTVGEITVTSPAVSDPYLHRPDATALARIADGDQVVHRMGDLGTIDAHGRLWFAGRKSERVRTEHGDWYTDHVEPIFNTVRGVHRTALVGVGAAPAQRPVLVVEPEHGTSRRERARIRADLLSLAQRQPHTAGLADVLFHRHFPMDVRHHSKIRRHVLAAWAAHRLKSGDRTGDGGDW